MPSPDPARAGIAALAEAMAAGALSAEELASACLARVSALDRRGPCLRAVIETNPDAGAIARDLDAERRRRGARGPLHGVPVLLKDNIDTADGMQTTAGSLALLGPAPPADATVAAALRAAGAVILGKTNLSEWANFRGHRSSSGWSARGGLTRNPHVLDRSAGGSSSGSGAAVAAGFVPAALGTETDGSIVSPATACGVVGLKPTVGLTSRAGVVPISRSQDSVGVLARSVADAALVLAAIAAAGPDGRDAATGQPGAAAVVAALRDPARLCADGALRGARLGVPRALWGRGRHAARVGEEALEVLRRAGAVLVDPVEVPGAGDAEAGTAELEVLLHEFRAGLDAYLAGRPGVPVRSLADVIAFNLAHADAELPYFGQELLLAAQERGPLSSPAYIDALRRSRASGGERGIDLALRAGGLCALVAPTGGPAWTSDLLTGDHGVEGSCTLAARAGYPLVSVPAGDVFGLPVNLTFMGTAWSDHVLIRLAHAFERAAPARREPAFLPTAQLP
jgi:amidase